MFGGSLVDRGHAVGPTRFSARLFVLRKEVGSPGSFAYVALAHDWADNVSACSLAMRRVFLSMRPALHAPCQGRKYRYAQLTGFVCGGASARRHYAVKEGDHLTLLNVYAGFEAAKRNAQWSAARLVNHRSMRNACETRKQLVNYISKLGVPLESCDRNATALRRTITAAFFCNAAKLESSGSYRTIRGQQQVFVHPFSVLHQHPSPWVIFHELTVSTKPYILGVLQIEPQWLSELAPHFYQFKGTSPHNGAGRGAEQGENTLGVRKQARHI